MPIAAAPALAITPRDQERSEPERRVRAPQSPRAPEETRA